VAGKGRGPCTCVLAVASTAYIFARTWLRYVPVFAIVNSSIVCLSSVTFVHLLRGLKLSAIFFVILYLSHRLTSEQNLTEIVPQEQLEFEVYA